MKEGEIKPLSEILNELASNPKNIGKFAAIQNGVVLAIGETRQDVVKNLKAEGQVDIRQIGESVKPQKAFLPVSASIRSFRNIP